MEGCCKILLKIVNFGQVFACLKVPQAVGHNGHCGTQQATHMLVLHWPAQHLPSSFSSPKSKTQTSSYCVNPDTKQAQFWPSKEESSQTHHSKTEGPDPA